MLMTPPHEEQAPKEMVQMAFSLGHLVVVAMLHCSGCCADEGRVRLL